MSSLLSLVAMHKWKGGKRGFRLFTSIGTWEGTRDATLWGLFASVPFNHWAGMLLLRDSEFKILPNCDVNYSDLKCFSLWEDFTTMATFHLQTEGEALKVFDFTGDRHGRSLIASLSSPSIRKRETWLEWWNPPSCLSFRYRFTWKWSSCNYRGIKIPRAINCRGRFVVSEAKAN